MKRRRIFISGVQKEFASERAAPRDYRHAEAEGPVTPPVTPPVEVLVRLLGRAGALGSAAIRAQLGLKDRTHLRERYLDPALADGLIELTLPEKPNSRLQQYRLTAKGAAVLAALPKASSS